MDRRTYLALGAALLAGCGQSRPSETTTTGGATTADATTATASPTTTATEEPTTQEPTTEESTTEESTTEETPTDAPAATEAIREARGHIRAAVDEYESYAPGARPTIHDVTAATGGFETARIRTRIEQARDALDRAERSASPRQENLVTDLGGVCTFLERAAVAQRALRNGFDSYGAAYELAYMDESASTRVTTLENTASTAGRSLATIDSETSAENTDAIDVLSREDYTRKRAQLGAERESYLLAASVIPPFEERRFDFLDAASAFANERWAVAAARFEDLADPYQELSETVGDVEPPAYLAASYVAFRCDVSALANAAPLLAESARFYDDDDEETGDERRQAALELFAACDTQSRLTAVRRLD